LNPSAIVEKSRKERNEPVPTEQEEVEKIIKQTPFVEIPQKTTTIVEVVENKQEEFP
tara:strand:+ start:567 stop:737 length:171 start_codon:yes stop_codon:yes gene_type:complete